MLSIFFLWHFIRKMLLSFLSEFTTNQPWMLLIFLTVPGHWSSLSWENRAHGTREFMYSNNRAFMTLEVVKKARSSSQTWHCCIAPPPPLFVFSELPGVHRACNFLFSESPIFLQLRALCPTACDSVLTNRYCPVGRMVAGTKELLSGFYSNPGSEIYEWTFPIVMWIMSAQHEGSATLGNINS